MVSEVEISFGTTKYKNVAARRYNKYKTIKLSDSTKCKVPGIKTI